jgi:hypothetical protein
MATIERVADGPFERAATRVLDGSSSSDAVDFFVGPGEHAECAFPAGARVRIKVGHDDAGCRNNPDGEVFASIWVNERKIASRVRFAGYCRDQRQPVISFIVDAARAEPTVRRCVRSNDASSPACEEQPTLTSYPVDRLEYPPTDAERPAVGTYEVLVGEHAVCETQRRFLQSDQDWRAMANLGLIREQPRQGFDGWTTSTVAVPGQSGQTRVSAFDFDNDGNVDRVLDVSFFSTYMIAGALLVQPGSSSSELVTAAVDPLVGSSFYPCQIRAPAPEALSCPPFSAANDEAGFGFALPSGESIYFRARYTSLVPFPFDGQTFVSATRNSPELDGRYVAVLKPRPDKTFEYVCLIKQVAENF